ncbi:RHS repeat-associated core domain-containing protein [Bradyrhizobium sp. S3.3.6]|uniref:RHS repeat-associated core domain-containing protein n=1 Tax=Bradyrhizobium sp. S3.3.6 TaxID=3156429 RepID=UPI003393ACF8
MNLIYEYVYSNIDYSPIYGVKKGAFGALLDGRGNDFDQAALMVALLRQSGYTANYIHGSITLSIAQLNNWLGIDTSTACPFANLMRQGGFPISIPNCNVSFSAANLPHVWVSATGGSLGTQTFVFDPSFKTYTTLTAGINLASAMNYSQSSFLSLAESGSTITSNSIQSVNGANINNALTGYANNLVSFIKSNLPAATLKDVIGGKYIQPITQPYSPSTTLPYETPGDTPQVWTGDIPSLYRTAIEIQVGGVDQTYYADQIYGHRLSIVYNSAAQPMLYLDGVLQGTGTANAATITYSVDFPFCFATSGSASAACGSSGGVNYTNIFTFQNVVQAGNGFTYAIVNGWDFTGRGMLDFHRQQLQANQAAGGSVNSEAVLGETLNMIGYAWLAQVSGNREVVDRIVGSTTVIHSAVGVVGQVTGPYIDMPGEFAGISSLTNDTNRVDTAAFTIGGNSSALEWGTLDQNLSKQNVGAVSTVKLLDIANSSNLVIYDATSSNWSTVQPLLSNYGAADLNTIQNTYINNGFRVILPQRGDITQNGWTGVGYLGIGVGAAGTKTITYRISSNLKGGYPDESISPADFVQLVQNTTPPLPPPTQFVSRDPIDLSTGAYLYDHDDIAFGSDSFPYGLTFSRSYTSNSRYNAGPLGHGWTHNFAISATVNSDGLKGLGQDSPIDGAAAIAAIYVAQDLFSDATKPLGKLVIASLSQRWFMDQLINNTVNISMGSQNEQFIRLADGSYNPQLGSSDRLALSGGIYTLRNKDSAAFVFNTNGSIAAWNNPSGVNVSFAYNGATPPQLTSISNNLGRSLTLSYNASNQIASVNDGARRAISYTYDGQNNLSSYTDPTGKLTTLSYTGQGAGPGLLTQIFYPSLQGSAFVTNTYDTLGRIASQANANGARWNYYFAGYRSEEDDPLGTRHVLYYNPRGKVQFDIQDIAGLDRVTTSRYDGLDRLISTTMPEGNNLAYTYDALVNAWANNIATITRNKKPVSPLPSTTQRFTYHPKFNKVASATDPLGLITTSQYDQKGNLIQTVADAGFAPHLNATTTSVYDAYGKLILTTDPTGTVTSSQYDSFENLIASVADYGSGHLNLTTRYDYDVIGNLVGKTDPNGRTATMTYDAARRLLATTAPAPFDFGTSLIQTSNGYDADGRLISVTRTNAGGNQVTRTGYTPTGKVKSVTDANGNTTTSTYDLDDRLQSVTQPISRSFGRVMSFSYDALSHLTKVVDNTGNAAEQYAYTANGKLASFTDARGNATTYTYDGFDRLSLITYPIGSTGTHPTEASSYDADDNVLARTTRAGGTISFSYDTLNRVCTKTIATSSTACAATSSASPAVWFRYDLAGRKTSIIDNSAAITAAVPPSPGTPVSYITSYSYDQINRLASVNWNPAQTFTVPAPSNVTFTHTYNSANQRTAQTVTDNSWWYYPPASPSQVNYGSNAANQYVIVGAVAPSYDANGNLTGDGTFTYGYDAENRLTSATSGGNTATYAYDSQGRRKSKTASLSTTISVADADNRIVLDYDGSTGAVLRWYAYGSGTNDVLNQTDIVGNARLTMIPDIQGSVLATLDSGTGIFTRQNYLPYGKSANATIAGTFGYTGQRIDSETNGLYYYRARMYYPAWGRFMQPDPLGTLTDNPQPGSNGTSNRANLYAYVSNDPLNRADPLGLYTFQFGFAGSVSLPFGFNVPVGLGIAIDTQGNVGLYSFAGGGVTFGASVDAGVNIWLTNAKTISDLTGPFLNASAHGGAGFGGSVDYTRGPSANGQVSGVGVTVGAGLGASVSAGVTNTWLIK